MWNRTSNCGRILVKVSIRVNIRPFAHSPASVSRFCTVLWAPSGSPSLFHLRQFTRGAAHPPPYRWSFHTARSGSRAREASALEAGPRQHSHAPPRCRACSGNAFRASARCSGVTHMTTNLPNQPSQPRPQAGYSPITTWARDNRLKPVSQVGEYRLKAVLLRSG